MKQASLIRFEGLVAGVDEAGRGPLAGPVVAAAVILSDMGRPLQVADSKTLSAARRAVLAAEIRQHSVAWAVAWADRAEIDALNILGATMLAMRRAIMGLRRLPDAVLVDGNRLPDLRFGEHFIPGDAIVGGDRRVPAVSAASILAKTVRDDLMSELDTYYPGYGFSRHKGYCTGLHREMLREHGPCALHRRSFAPVRDSL